MPTTIAKVRYGPTLRNGTTTRRDGGTTAWWMILDCDPELGRLYRHQYTIATYKTRTVQAPLWGPHVSVIRGEIPNVPTGWGTLADAEIEIEYVPEIHETDGYLWLPVACPALLTHREELGLPRDPTPPLHLTIGNLVRA